MDTKAMREVAEILRDTRQSADLPSLAEPVESGADEIDKLRAANSLARDITVAANKRIKRMNTANAKLLAIVKSAVEVIDSKEMHAMEFCAHNHGMPYNGPIFDVEKARAAIAEGE